MMIDIGICVLMVIMGASGWQSGGTPQILRLVVSMLALVLAYVLSAEAGKLYQGFTNSGAESAVLSAFFVTWFILTLVLRFGVGRLVTDMGAVGYDLSGINRLVGGVVGIARGGILGAVLILAAFTIYNSSGKLALEYDKSRAARKILEMDPFRKPINKVMDAMDDPGRKFNRWGEKHGDMLDESD